MDINAKVDEFIDSKNVTKHRTKGNTLMIHFKKFHFGLKFREKLESHF